MKVHEFKDQINESSGKNISSKEVIEIGKTIGIDIKAASSNIPEDKVEELKATILKESKEIPKAVEKAGENKEKPVKKAPMRTAVVSPEVAARGPKGKPVVSDEVAKRAEKEKTEKENKEAVVEAKKDVGTETKETIKKETKKEEVKTPEAKAEEGKKKEAGAKEQAAISGVQIVKRAEDIKKEEEKAKIEASKKGATKKEFTPKAKREENTLNKKDMPREKSAQSSFRGKTEFNKGKSDFNKGKEEMPTTKAHRKPMATEEATNSNKPGKKQGKDFKKKDNKDVNERDKVEKLGKQNKKYTKLSYEDGDLEKKIKGKKQQKVKEVVEPEIVMEDMPVGTRIINVPITVAGFCEQMGVSNSQVIMTLLKLGVVSNINATLDEDTVQLVAEELNLSVVIGKVEEEILDEGIENFVDREDQLQERPPIITVMGHVDHGKTSLLDAIRKTNVTAQESGGITQHIGASEVEINDRKIVFLDTPGHEAFTAMRARGANITDIAVLVVAADDSVKPQTIESISHAKAAGVPIIVAINKMDKPGANPDMVKQDLSSHGVVVEEWGGDVIAVPVSAKTGEGIVNLLEMILLQSEVLELKANKERFAMGTVIEARLDKAKGPVATLLVTNGTLKAGQSVVAGTTSGKIRLMTNHKGDTIRKAGPATAVEILGLTEVPAAGDEFNSVKDDRLAKEIAEKRKGKQREEVLARNSSTTLEELFSQIQEGEVKDLNLIVKGDVRGSVGAVITSLEKLSAENVRVKIVHSGVGAVTESDVTLASTAGAIIIGFNVRPSVAVTTLANRENVQIKTYRVIYDIIDDITNAIKGMLDPEYEEVVLGTVEIRDTFKVPGVGIIGGAYVTSGKILRNAEVRLVRDGIVIHEGKISSLKRFKDDAKEVAQGYECGIGIENYNDIKEGDVIECFQMEEVARH